MAQGIAKATFLVNGVAQTSAPPAGIYKLKIEWTADPGGSVSWATTPAVVSGFPVRFVTKPDVGTPPSNNYNVTIKEETGIDIANGALAARSSTLTQEIPTPSLAITDGTNTATSYRCLSDVLTIDVSGAGAGGKGSVFIVVKN